MLSPRSRPCLARSMELPLKKSAASSEIYLDYAGMAPVVQEVIAAVSHVLASQPLGNPHSGGHSSQRAQSILSQGRACILDFCGASPLEYYVVFTAGATASIKLVGEAFQWTSKSVFAYTLENHTSVVGLRNLAVAAGASARVVDLDSSTFPVQLSSDADSSNLFAFPGECNFSGDLYSLRLCHDVRCGLLGPGKWFVLVDAAKLAAGSPIVLSNLEHPPDFLAISFYKMFGFPTGIGALLVRRRAAHVLRRNMTDGQLHHYFGGGTVQALSATSMFVSMRPQLAASLEDGSANVHGVAAVLHGLHFLSSIGMQSICRYNATLRSKLVSMLNDMKYGDSKNFAIIHDAHHAQRRHKWIIGCGAIVSFTLLKADGSCIGYTTAPFPHCIFVTFDQVHRSRHCASPGKHSSENRCSVQHRSCAALLGSYGSRHPPPLAGGPCVLGRHGRHPWSADGGCQGFVWYVHH